MFDPAVTLKKAANEITMEYTIETRTARELSRAARSLKLINKAIALLQPKSD